MTLYLDLTKAKSGAALQEFLDERGPALARLRETLSAELRGRELEVWLRENSGHEHNGVVGHVVKVLGRENGITRVLRKDREVLLVATPNWSAGRLQEWVAGYLENKIRD